MSARAQVVVAGAGILGLASALALTQAGAQVLLLDPAPEGPSASAVAAGLLAPVGEAVFDPLAAPHYPLMLAAMALWPAFALNAGIAVDTSGSLIPDSHIAALDALGVPREPFGGGWRVADGRVAAPTAALAALRAHLLAAGGRIESRPVEPGDWRAEAVVLAAGPGALGLIDLAPELAHLTPVKGQIAILPNGPADGPAIRWAGGYLVPQAGGARAGATMEVGRDDLTVEADVLARLAEVARGHAPDLDISGAYGQAGVRMQTPDALPLVGLSRAAKTILATGARRNGWLYAPLVGQMVAAYLMGQDPGPWAAMLHPARFGRK